MKNKTAKNKRLAARLADGKGIDGNRYSALVHRIPALRQAVIVGSNNQQPYLFMKISLLLGICIMTVLFPLKAQKINRKDAADALNFIDNLTNPLKPSAYKLLAHFQKLNTAANVTNNYKLPNTQIDTLKEYFNILISEYDKAIKKANQNKTIDKFQGLKSNFLNLLYEGRKPWATVIPVYIKMYTKGRDFLNVSEQNLVSNRGSIFRSSAEKALEWAKVVATQEEEIEKKYHLELVGDLYK